MISFSGYILIKLKQKQTQLVRKQAKHTKKNQQKKTSNEKMNKHLKRLHLFHNQARTVEFTSTLAQFSALRGFAATVSFGLAWPMEFNAVMS